MQSLNYKCENNQKRGLGVSAGRLILSLLRRWQQTLFKKPPFLNPPPSAPTWKEKYNSEPRASIHSPTLTSLTKQSCNYVELLIQTNWWIVPAPRTCDLFFHNICFCSQMWECEKAPFPAKAFALEFLNHWVIVARFFTSPTFFWTFHWMDDSKRVRFLLRLNPAWAFRAGGCSLKERSVRAHISPAVKQIW